MKELKVRRSAGLFLSCFFNEIHVLDSIQRSLKFTPLWIDLLPECATDGHWNVLNRSREQVANVLGNHRPLNVEKLLRHLPFNCNEGLTDWKSSWPEAKKQWCCRTGWSLKGAKRFGLCLQTPKKREVHQKNSRTYTWKNAFTKNPFFSPNRKNRTHKGVCLVFWWIAWLKWQLQATQAQEIEILDWKEIPQQLMQFAWIMLALGQVLGVEAGFDGRWQGTKYWMGHSGTWDVSLRFIQEDGTGIYTEDGSPFTLQRIEESERHWYGYIHLQANDRVHCTLEDNSSLFCSWNESNEDYVVKASKTEQPNHNVTFSV